MIRYAVATMAMTSAQQQAAYRARHFKAEGGRLARLSLAVSPEAKAQIERLATYYAVTQREVMESLLRLAERAVLDSLPGDDKGRYHVTKPGLPSNGG